MLEKMGYDVVYVGKPEFGIESASHLYDVVFVDFDFADTSGLDGADISRNLEARCPLLPRILASAYGSQNETLSRIMGVTFHAWFPKEIEGEDPRDIPIRLKKTILDAKQAVERSFTLNFEEDDVLDMKERLDALETAYKMNAGKEGKINNIKEVTDAAQLIMRNSDGELSDEEKRDLIILRSRCKADQDSARRMRKRYSMTTANRWSQCFQIKRGAELLPDALKVRFLLKRYPKQWIMARKDFPQLKKLVDYFCLGNDYD